MFKRKPKTQDETDSGAPSGRTKSHWLKIAFLANLPQLVIVALVAGSAFVVHLSDTDPNFCGTCHVMQAHVTSYFTSGNLDNVHQQSGVLCKDCHDYPLDQEIKAGVDYLTNNYVVDDTGELARRDFGDEICTQCHISMEHVAVQTDFLRFNPHNSGMGEFTCNTCHLSHGEQIDYCSECHINGGQRMIGDTTPRQEQLGEFLPAPNPYGS